ncbi:MAG TPA: DNA recombination/repair protein RecA, partial [Candidatus Xenobia bacterium]
MIRDLSEKQKAVQTALVGIEKAHGKGAIMRLGDAPEPGPIETISTGAPGLDLAIGVGGLPRGRIIE